MTAHRARDSLLIIRAHAVVHGADARDRQQRLDELTQQAEAGD